jgi:hypothetical protein
MGTETCQGFELEIFSLVSSKSLTVMVYGKHLEQSPWILCAEAERIVQWAIDHHLGLCLLDPATSNGKLMIPRDRYVIYHQFLLGSSNKAAFQVFFLKL